MKHFKIHLESDSASWRSFKTAASLHGHTLCSHETLGFINKLARSCAPIRMSVNRGKVKYKEANGSELDLTRGWWTPPAAPRDAWLLERRQIENRLGKQSLVSLTDHDSIEAPIGLRVREECRDVPISVEWTVPYGPTFFHLGVHNLPPDSARELMAAMAEYRVSRNLLSLTSLLHTLAEFPETLLVFNHPCWDEFGVGQATHTKWANQFAAQYGSLLHALELNGLRPWPENRLALRMARDLDKPIISGGDRHTLEPNTMLDLTNATSFAEYVQQVRTGHSDVLLTNQYREPFQLRIMQGLQELMQDHEDHGYGWRRWSDRVFYRCDDGVVRSMTTLFANHIPGSVQIFIRGLGFIRYRGVQQTFRLAFPRLQELAL